jgi:lipoprotein-releasing system ATP-binding protein
MLKAKGIQKYYGDLHVLKGVDVEIFDNEGSFCGGSIRCREKYTYSIFWEHWITQTKGRYGSEKQMVSKLKGDKLADFRNSQIGFIFQFHNLLPEFTAEENILIPGLIAGKPETELRNRAKELSQLLGFEKRLSHKPSELSGGEQQRVAVARALINNPRIVFADEPSGNLDSQNAQALHELFFKLRENFGQSFVIVTHNGELAKMADRTLTMQDGKILSMVSNEKVE